MILMKIKKKKMLTDIFREYFRENFKTIFLENF